MNLDAYDEVLKKGYPGIQDLRDFPLADELEKLDRLAWTSTARPISLEKEEPDIPKSELADVLRKENRMLREEKLGEVYRQHIKGVMRCLNFLIERDLGSVLPEFTPAEWARSPFFEYNDFLGGANKEFMKFLRFVALYHDIGKVIHRDRHTMLGQHLLESISDDATRSFKTILDGSYLMMSQLIAHHDLFGVLWTGEASRPVLVDALRLKQAEETINALVTLNLADIYGALSRMTPRIMTTVLNDWKFIRGLIREEEPVEGIVYKSDLERAILKQSQEQERTTERLRRLLVTIIYMLKNLTDDEKTSLARGVTNDVVFDALKNRLGPELRVFCFDFALVCKFDYTLRFFVDLVSAWVKKQKAARDPEGINIGEVDIRGISAILVEILVRLVTNYRDLTRQREGWPRRIGIELLGLTRSTGISKRVIELLLSGRRTEGVNWIADEATAWYFV